MVRPEIMSTRTHWASLGCLLFEGLCVPVLRRKGGNRRHWGNGLSLVLGGDAYFFLSQEAYQELPLRRTGQGCLPPSVDRNMLASALVLDRE